MYTQCVFCNADSELFNVLMLEILIKFSCVSKGFRRNFKTTKCLMKNSQSLSGFVFRRNKPLSCPRMTSLSSNQLISGLISSFATVSLSQNAEQYRKTCTELCHLVRSHRPPVIFTFPSYIHGPESATTFKYVSWQCRVTEQWVPSPGFVCVSPIYPCPIVKITLNGRQEYK